MFKNTFLFILVILLLSACGGKPHNPNESVVPNNSGKAPEETNEIIEPEPVEPEPKTEPNPEPKDPVVTPDIDEALEKQYAINPKNWKVEPLEDADPKVVLITIDDAPDQHSLAMAKQLKELDAPAIFFVNGHFLNTPEEIEILKEIYEMGFAIGNHTFSHTRLDTLDEAEQQLEISLLGDLIEDITGERPVFFRAPHGVNTEISDQIVKKEGMVKMNWSYGYDWERQYQDAEALTEIMLNTPYLSSGSNLLMHDRAWTNKALPGIINGLRDKGYTLVDPKSIQGIIERENPTEEVQP